MFGFRKKKQKRDGKLHIGGVSNSALLDKAAQKLIYDALVELDDFLPEDCEMMSNYIFNHIRNNGCDVVRKADC